MGSWECLRCICNTDYFLNCNYFCLLRNPKQCGAGACVPQCARAPGMGLPGVRRYQITLPNKANGKEKKKSSNTKEPGESSVFTLHEHVKVLVAPGFPFRWMAPGSSADTDPAWGARCWRGAEPGRSGWTFTFPLAADSGAEWWKINTWEPGGKYFQPLTRECILTRPR